MNRSGIRVIAVLTALGVMAAAAAIGAAPEHDRLKAMCGSWDVEMTFVLQPGRPGITTKGTSTIRPLFDGLFIEEKIEGTLNGRPFTTLAWTGFNTTTRQYEATRIASTQVLIEWPIGWPSVRSSANESAEIRSDMRRCASAPVAGRPGAEDTKGSIWETYRRSWAQIHPREGRVLRCR